MELTFNFFIGNTDKTQHNFTSIALHSNAHTGIHYRWMKLHSEAFNRSSITTHYWQLYWRIFFFANITQANILFQINSREV